MQCTLCRTIHFLNIIRTFFLFKLSQFYIGVISIKIGHGLIVASERLLVLNFHCGFITFRHYLCRNVYGIFIQIVLTEF